MTFLRNAWYAAGWQEQLAAGTAIRIEIMSEWIAIFRTETGALHAIHDRCPHRFAALGSGKVIGENLRCPYHGLAFDGAGKCVSNPHGDGMIPPGAGVRPYPVTERHGVLWVWMGDAERADLGLIPDFAILDDPSYVVSRGYLEIKSHYELVTDNLLDLSHAAFIHPFLATLGTVERTRTQVSQDGTTVYNQLWVDDEPITPLFQLVWDHPAETAVLRSHTRWSPPSHLFLDVGMTPTGSSEKESPTFPSAHLLTPASPDRTHYFWTIGRNRKLDDANLTKTIHEAIAYAFEHEDEPMIEQAFLHMKGSDFWSLRPLILEGDGAAVRARRIVQKLARNEDKHLSESVPAVAAE